MTDHDRQTIGTPTQAEELAASWMRQHGFADASVGPRGRDRGLDVISSAGLAQVKWGGGAKRGAPAIQNLYGARGRDHSRALLFFTGPTFGYTDEAVQVADDLDVALLRYDIHGKVYWCNEAGRRIVTTGREPTGRNVDADAVVATLTKERFSLGGWFAIFFVCVAVSVSSINQAVYSNDSDGLAGAGIWILATVVLGTILAVAVARRRRRRQRAVGLVATIVAGLASLEGPLKPAADAAPNEAFWCDYRATSTDVYDALIRALDIMTDESPVTDEPDVSITGCW